MTPIVLNKTIIGTAEDQQAVAFWGGSVAGETSQYLYMLPLSNSSSSFSPSSSSSSSHLPFSFLTPFVSFPPTSDECTYSSAITMVSNGTCLALVCVTKTDYSQWSFLGLTTNEKLKWSREFIAAPTLLSTAYSYSGSYYYYYGGGSVWCSNNTVYFFTFNLSPVPFYAVELSDFFNGISSSSSSLDGASSILDPALEFRSVNAYPDSMIGNPSILGASLMYFESSNSIYLYGGQTNVGIPGAAFNENILRFSLSTSRWTVENVASPSPIFRLGSAFAVYMHYFLIYGGFGGATLSEFQSAASVSDMWCFDTVRNIWKRVDFETVVVKSQDGSISTTQTHAPVLYGMSSAVAQGEWFIFGGQGDDKIVSSTLYRVSLTDVMNQPSLLLFNSSTTAEPATLVSDLPVVPLSLLSWGVSGDAPFPRRLAQVIVSENNRMFVYSGLFGTSSIQAFDDMYVLDLVTRIWTNISGIPSLPAGRGHATFTWIDKYTAALYGSYPVIDPTLYLFSIPNDRNSFNFAWTAVTSNATSVSPVARNCHMAASLNGSLFIVGGFDQNNTSLIDTWSFSPVAGWKQLADVNYMFTSLDGMVAFNNKLYVNFFAGQVSEYDPVLNAWSFLAFQYDRPLVVGENGGIANFGSSVYLVDGDIGSAGLSEFVVFDLVSLTVTHPETPSFALNVAARTFVDNSFVCQSSLPRCFLFGGLASNGTFLNDVNIMSVDIIDVVEHGSDIGCVQSPTTPCKSLSAAIGFYSSSFLLPSLNFSFVQYTVHPVNSTQASTIEPGDLGKINGGVTITQPLLIRSSADGPAFILDCHGGRCLNINGASASVTLQGFTIKNAGLGAVSVNQNGTLILQGMDFVDNTGIFGGAIHLDSSALFAFDSRFDFHSAYQGGSIFASFLSTVYADRCTFSHSTVTAFGHSHSAYGGAIYAVSGSSITLTNCIFADNNAISESGLGGAIFSLLSSVFAHQCIFTGNHACNGGAIASMGVAATNITDVSSLLASFSSLLVLNSTFSSNTANSSGGAIYVSAADGISLSQSSFTSNVAYLHGAAVYADSKNLTSFNVSACVFQNNICQTGAGGGIFSNPPPFPAPFFCSIPSSNDASFFQSQPLVTNMSRQDSNFAVYGPWLASPPICLLLNMSNISASDFNLEFNHPLAVPDPSQTPSYFVGEVPSAVPLTRISVELIDAFRNLVVNHNTLTVVQASLTNLFPSNVTLTGSLTSASSGTSTFDHLVVSGSPGQKTSITFQSTMLGRTVFSTPNLIYAIRNCPVGSYIDSDQCIPCPDGTFSFSVNSEKCVLCDANADCTQHQYIAQQGWWAYVLPNKMGVVPCLATLCVGNNSCAGLRPNPSVNLLCGHCLPGYNWWNGDCVICPPLAVSLLLLVLFVGIAFVMVSRYFSLTSSCQIGIFTYYTQMVRLLLRSGSSSAWLSIFDLSPAQMGVACFFNLGYYSDIVTGFVSPFLLFILLGFCMCMHGLLMSLSIPFMSDWLLSLDKARVTADGLPISFVDSYVRAFIYLVVSSYQGITLLVISSLNVVSISTYIPDDNGGVVLTTARMLYEYPAIDAGSSGYHTLFSFAVLLAICIVVGVPLILFTVLTVIRPTSMHPHIIARYGVLYEA